MDNKNNQNNVRNIEENINERRAVEEEIVKEERNNNTNISYDILPVNITNNNENLEKYNINDSNNLNSKNIDNIMKKTIKKDNNISSGGEYSNKEVNMDTEKYIVNEKYYNKILTIKDKNNTRDNNYYIYNKHNNTMNMENTKSISNKDNTKMNSKIFIDEYSNSKFTPENNNKSFKRDTFDSIYEINNNIHNYKKKIDNNNENNIDNLPSTSNNIPNCKIRVNTEISNFKFKKFNSSEFLKNNNPVKSRKGKVVIIDDETHKPYIPVTPSTSIVDIPTINKIIDKKPIIIENKEISKNYNSDNINSSKNDTYKNEKNLNNKNSSKNNKILHKIFCENEKIFNNKNFSKFNKNFTAKLLKDNSQFNANNNKLKLNSNNTINQLNNNSNLKVMI